MSWDATAKKCARSLPLHAARADEPQIGFIDQPRGLQRMPGALAMQAAPRDRAQLAIDEGDQPFERRLVAAAPFEEQLGDAVRARGSHRGLMIGAHVFLAAACTNPPPLCA